MLRGRAFQEAGTASAETPTWERAWCASETPGGWSDWDGVCWEGKGEIKSEEWGGGRFDRALQAIVGIQAFPRAHWEPLEGFRPRSDMG